MTGTLAVRAASLPSQPFGRPEALRALSALAFGVAIAALSLPPMHLPTRPDFVADPAVEPWVQVLVIAAMLVTGWLLWRRAGWYARHAADHPTARARIFYALMTVLTGFAAAGIVPLRFLASGGRIPYDSGAAPASIALLLIALILMVLGVSALLPRPRFRHTGLLPRADAPSRHSVALWPFEARPREHGPGTLGEPLLAPAARVLNSLPPPAHSGGYTWNVPTARPPEGPAASFPIIGAGSRRSRVISGRPFLRRVAILALGLALIWLVLKALEGSRGSMLT